MPQQRRLSLQTGDNLAGLGHLQLRGGHAIGLHGFGGGALEIVYFQIALAGGPSGIR
jgi:hypothetical protein